LPSGPRSALILSMWLCGYGRCRQIMRPGSVLSFGRDNRSISGKHIADSWFYIDKLLLSWLNVAQCRIQRARLSDPAVAVKGALAGLHPPLTAPLGHSSEHPIYSDFKRGAHAREREPRTSYDPLGEVNKGRAQRRNAHWCPTDAVCPLPKIKRGRRVSGHGATTGRYLPAVRQEPAPGQPEEAPSVAGAPAQAYIPSWLRVNFDKGSSRQKLSAHAYMAIQYASRARCRDQNRHRRSRHGGISGGAAGLEHTDVRWQVTRHFRAVT